MVAFLLFWVTTFGEDTIFTVPSVSRACRTALMLRRLLRKESQSSPAGAAMEVTPEVPGDQATAADWPEGALLNPWMPFQKGACEPTQGVLEDPVPPVMAAVPLLAWGHLTPNWRCQSLLASTTRASICTCWIWTSRVSSSSEMTGIREGRSVMMRVLVRSSRMAEPRLVIISLRMRWTSLTL